MEELSMNVVSIKKNEVKTTSKVKTNRAQSKAMKRQVMSAIGIGGVAVTLTALSLNHLAHGIEIVTNAPNWEAYAMAIGIDCGFISAELAQLFASNDKLAKKISRFTKPAIIGTLIGSAAMNAFAFSNAVQGWMLAPAVILGIAIPALIYALTRIGGALYMDCHNKS
jgi:H+/Cl- antiporter ClcA